MGGKNERDAGPVAGSRGGFATNCIKKGNVYLSTKKEWIVDIE
jgi:hypothetical protein